MFYVLHEGVSPMSKTRSDLVRRESDPEYVQAILDLRRGSRTRPEGALRGRNRQNERRHAIERSRDDR